MRERITYLAVGMDPCTLNILAAPAPGQGPNPALTTSMQILITGGTGLIEAELADGVALQQLLDQLRAAR
jgi:hypothetical protein